MAANSKVISIVLFPSRQNPTHNVVYRWTQQLCSASHTGVTTDRFKPSAQNRNWLRKTLIITCNHALSPLANFSNIWLAWIHSKNGDKLTRNSNRCKTSRSLHDALYFLSTVSPASNSRHTYAFVWTIVITFVYQHLTRNSMNTKKTNLEFSLCTVLKTEQQFGLRKFTPMRQERMSDIYDSLSQHMIKQ